MADPNPGTIDEAKVARRIHAVGAIEDQNYLWERIEFENGTIAERNFIQTPLGWQEIKSIPNHGNFVHVLVDFNKPFEQQNQLEVTDCQTGKLLNSLMRVEPFTFADQVQMVIRSVDKHKWQEEQNRLEVLHPTQEEYSDFLTKIQSKSTISIANVTDLIDQIQNNKLSAIKPKFFKGIDHNTEFGVSRIISDRVFHLAKLLEKLNVRPIAQNSYKLHASEVTSAGTVGLEYFFTSSNDEQAEKVASIFKKKIAGVGERLWLACWDIANEAGSSLFVVDSYDLYRKCHPGRKAYPNGEERKEFYNLVRLLECTKFSFTRSNNKKSAATTTYELPVIQICSYDGCESSGWPRRLRLQVLPTLTDKMAFVAAPIHKNTLHLDSADCHLATILQNRRSQYKSADIISFSVEDLIEHAGLHITAQTKPQQAKKLLLAKLARLKGKGIIKGHSTKLSANSKEKVNIMFHTRKLGVTVPEVGGSSYS